MIKFGMTIAEMITQLTRGFMKATGRKPDGIEKIKIQYNDYYKIVVAPGPNEINDAKDINALCILDNGKALDISQLSWADDACLMNMLRMESTSCA